MKELETLNDSIRQTRTAFLATSLLGMPFWAIYTLLLFILYKDLHATPLQITTFIILRPLVSMFSIYWSAQVDKRKDKLKANILWATLLAPFPFLFLPIIDNPWFIILASALYMTLYRGVYPAWMEILKINLPDEMRQKVVSYGTTFSFVGGGLLSLAFGYLMDEQFQIWRWIFPLAGFLSILAALFQWRMTISLNFRDIMKKGEEGTLKTSVIHQIAKPWKNVWHLMSTRSDYRRFQLGYMLGGFGLVIFQPALPAFFIDTLNLSYTELTTAITLCKGIAFALTSSFWAKWLRPSNIYQFASVVALLVSVFPLLLISAQWHLIWVYLAYMTYGVMQSGSELSWHLAGPIFAKGEDSSSYSSVNLAVVGLRGCIAPLMGSFLVASFNPVSVLLIGCALSSIASGLLYMAHKQAAFAAKIY